jgi:hypothetical protein
MARAFPAMSARSTDGFAPWKYVHDGAMAVSAAREGAGSLFFKLAFAMGIVVFGLELGYLCTRRFHSIQSATWSAAIL